MSALPPANRNKRNIDQVSQDPHPTDAPRPQGNLPASPVDRDIVMQHDQSHDAVTQQQVRPPSPYEVNKWHRTTGPADTVTSPTQEHKENSITYDGLDDLADDFPHCLDENET